MVICFRCQRNVAQFECEICNGAYCSDCDEFIHSKIPKINHKRNPIKIYEQIDNPRNFSKISVDPNSNCAKSLNNLDQNQIDNNLLNSNSNWNNNSLYPDNLENNKSVTIPKDIEQENKNRYQLLSQTYQPPSDNFISNIDINEKENQTKTNIKEEFNEEEEIKNNENPIPPSKNLNNCILNKDNKYEVLKDKNKNNNKKKKSINQKDEEIRRLQKSIEEQREIINKLKEENNNLEEMIEKDRQKKDELYKEKERLYNRKRKIEDFYSEKQREIQKIHDLEKYKLIEDFECQIREIGDNYINKKIEYMKGIQEIEEKMREYEKNREIEKKNMFDEIDRLKNEGINEDKEQEYLIKSYDELNNKLRETTSNMDLLRATALMSTVPKMKSLIKNKKKKKGH